ncbi:MAG TPA: glycogen synthase [Candidatus Omnitrophota bacterium]|jgi:glycogen synthase|nr:glycogen synthase [Candidatus Omnitrophota bacterium]
MSNHKTKHKRHSDGLKALLLTNEYPPYVYGGAGVHVDYLSRELSRLCPVDIRCFGDQKIARPGFKVTGFGLQGKKPGAPKELLPVFGALRRCVDFNAAGSDADIVHVHTWYTHLGGILAKLNYGIPLVLTTHSLEPLRPWKREQLGNGYDFSCWIEKTAIEMADAVVAVSEEARRDVLRLFRVDKRRVHVIHNGIDPQEYRKGHAPEKIRRFGINLSRPYVLFVGRITRQKGIIHLVNAIRHMDPGFQVVLCAGAPDTKEIWREMKARVAEIRKERPGVIWIDETVDDPVKIALYSHAALFCCPSIYEPFGIINLEAMACEVPVVASAVGGIKEVVVPGETGTLVPVRQHRASPFEPIFPGKFSEDLAREINRLMKDAALRKRMGKAGRRRVIKNFSWRSVAKKYHALYRSLTRPSGR